jgi:hypothetical protein
MEVNPPLEEDEEVVNPPLELVVNPLKDFRTNMVINYYLLDNYYTVVEYNLKSTHLIR